MTAIRQSLVYAGSESLSMEATDNPVFPFRLVTDGLAYADGDFEVDLRATLDMSRTEVQDLIKRATVLVDGVALTYEDSIALHIDKAWLEALVSAFGLRLTEPGETEYTPVPRAVTIRTENIAGLAALLGYGLADKEA